MAVQTLTLADLQISRPISDKDGRPTAELLRTINGNNRNIKQIVNELASQLADIQAALDAAQDAQTAAEESIRETARINSYTVPTNVLTAADAGSNVTITIAAHTRVYPVQGAIDVPDVTIPMAQITGLPYSANLYVYYDDVTMTDTTPNFIATNSATEAQPGFAAGRHFVGFVVTPAMGAGSTGGTGGYPPGGGGGNPIP